MYLQNNSTTEDSLFTSTNGEFGNSELDTGYPSWNAGSLLILLLFALIQISIWSFFIFCYFARGKTNNVNKIPPSVAIIDLPPEYEIAVNKVVFVPFPMDADPPTYLEVISSGSQLDMKQHQEKLPCSCIV